MSKYPSITKKIEYLKTDILNSPNHIFGVHKKARQPSVILYSDFVHSSLFQPFLRCLSRVANFSSSLLFDVDNNASECYNWIVNKFVGGKRIDFSLKGSQEGYNAIVDYNTYIGIKNKYCQFCEKYLARKMDIRVIKIGMAHRLQWRLKLL
jgi:hypothetical protein